MKLAIHLPGLNGIRAIASLAVVVSHTTIALNTFGVNTSGFGSFAQGLDLAGFGVTMFFCLSGFLITYLLLHEKEVTHTVNVRSFYMRRVLRIWPLYYAFIVVSVFYLWFKGENLDLSKLMLYIFLLGNFVFNPIPLIGHYWSLGVEEQFYAFWPWLARLNRKKLFYLSSFLIIIGVGAKLYIRLFIPNFDMSLAYKIVHGTRFHCMAIGAVGSILFFERRIWFLNLCQNSLTQGVVFISLGAMLVNRFHFASFMDMEIVACLTVALIVGQLDLEKRKINLDTKFFDFFGRISFSVYVLHPIFIDIFSKPIYDLHLSNSLSIPLIYTLVIGVTILVAYISYNYFEKPFLRIKTKYTIVASSASKQLN
ncbi:acyltransferase [Hymenobacter lutimineralis]|uniref:Acyltransferase n=1 Tax=Hymenobacter lutimineralis TaxID=2606448 RepID=A0A5D6UVH3_9BACT|nr:acyltransferase [Hymenobacter lutimineralis]TYZ07586.1 acyltransferase [Hymenobacter lutimineralis]